MQCRAVIRARPELQSIDHLDMIIKRVCRNLFRLYHVERRAGDTVEHVMEAWKDESLVAAVRKGRLAYGLVSQIM